MVCMARAQAEKLSAADLVRALGATAIMERLGVSRSSIKEARRAGAFPASWFVAMESLGAEQGVAVPRELFNWRTVDAA